MSSVFFGCVGPTHWETYLREASASFREVKGSLRGGVLLGVAYAGGYARIILSANLKKPALRQLWLLSRYLAFCGFISFFFGFCGFISFHFGLLWLHLLSFWPFVPSTKVFGFVLLRDQWLLPSYLPYGWGYQLLTRGLRGGYAALTRGELVASDKRTSQLQGHQIPQKSQSLIFDII